MKQSYRKEDPVYNILVKISIVLFILFSIWLIYDHFVKRPPQVKHYLKANIAFKDKDYELALQEYLSSLNYNNKDVYFMEGVARSYMELKLYDKEIKDYSYIEYSSIVQHVNQDLLGSLNPKMKIRDILFDLNKLIKKNKDVFNNLIFQYLQKLNLNPKVLDLYPIQLSGGQRQRILIVKSLLWSPKFLIMDEPVSSLDPYVQIEIIDIIKKLKIERNLTLLVISHDINFIKKICERVCILENGQIIEDGDVEEIINSPKHEYTKKLLIN